jgi:hypothetical protein
MEGYYGLGKAEVWEGPKYMTPQLQLFVDGIMLKGMGKREAAIAAGVNPANAQKQAWRWSNCTVVLNYIESSYEADSLAHRERIWTTINHLTKMMLDPATPKPVQLGCAAQLVSIYKDAFQKDLLDAGKTNPVSTDIIETLADRIRNAVPVRTAEDLLEESFDEVADSLTAN